MHTLQRLGGVLLLSLSLAACGGEDEEDDPPDTSGTDPVATTSLSGTIDGRPFTAVSALATEWFDGEKAIEIYDTQQDCDSFASQPTGSRSIFITGMWNPHTEQLSFNNNITFVVQEEDAPLNIIVTKGRLEYVETPAAVGQVGKLRLRGIAGADKVEGEVAVTVCE